jgi:hypothetical protein
MLVLLGTFSNRVRAAALQDGGESLVEQEADSPLSPYWSVRIRQWSDLITKEALANGLDPDFVAAVVEAESNGNQFVVSRVGAVGLMGIMPTGPGLEWRPTEEQLFKPNVNLSWGVAILGEIIRQSGGDISAALAAYSGGWDQVTSRVPRQYASQVLDLYGRAVAVRNRVAPEIASKWTIATELTRGHIPVEELILHDQPISGLRKYGEHVVFHYTDDKGYTYYVRGYAVPLALVVPLEMNTGTSRSDSVDSQLMERLGVTETKISDSNPRVLLACLPSLSRLRGQLATRWFAPSSCPSWHP